MSAGIYMIRNTVNNKVYIGSSVDIHRRWIDHKSELENNKHTNDYLQKSYNLHGKKCFEFSILEEIVANDRVELEQKLLEREDVYIQQYNSLDPDFGYNLLTADRHYMSDAVRRKMSNTRKNMKNPMHFEEVKKKISKALTGKPLSEEHRKKLSKNHADVSGVKNPMYGKTGEQSSFYGRHHSEETKQKLSEAMSGRKFTEEHKRKLSEAKKFTHLSEETKKKVSLYQKNRPMTPEREKQIQDALNKAHKSLGKPRKHTCPKCGYKFVNSNPSPMIKCENCRKKR